MLIYYYVTFVDLSVISVLHLKPLDVSLQFSVSYQTGIRLIAANIDI